MAKADAVSITSRRNLLKGLAALPAAATIAAAPSLAEAQPDTYLRLARAVEELEAAMAAHHHSPVNTIVYSATAEEVAEGGSATVWMTASFAEAPWKAADPADPIFEVIERHRAARAAFVGADFETQDGQVILDHEQDAWEELVATEPATFAGLAAFAGHVAEYPDLDNVIGAEGPADALRSIAAALRHIKTA